MNTYQTNINSIHARLTHKPVARTCDLCATAPAVRYATRRDERDGTYCSAWVCAYCASKVGKE